MLSRICLSFLHSQCTPAPGSTWIFIEHTCTSFRPHHHPYLNAHLTALQCPISFVYVLWKRCYEVDFFRYFSDLSASYSVYILQCFSPACVFQCPPVYLLQCCAPESACVRCVCPAHSSWYTCQVRGYGITLL